MELLIDLLERCEKLDIRGWYRAKEELAALREAGEKMAKSLRENKRVVDLGNPNDQWAFTPEDAEALAEWEAANK